MARTRRSKVDVAALSEEDREAYEKRREAARAPKDAYLVYRLDEAGNLDIEAATRDANEVLKMTSGQVELKYQHFMIK